MKFESDDKSFSVEIPVSPEKTEFSYKDVEGKGYRYKAYKDGTSFYIFSYPNAAAPTKENIKNPSPWFLEAKWRTAMVFDEYKAKTTELKSGKYAVTLAGFTEQKGNPSTNVHRILNVAVGDRFLSFRVVDKFGADPEAWMRFLESIRVGGEKTRLLSERPNWAKDKPAVVESNKNGSGIGTGRGTGQGRGAGKGSGMGSGQGSGVGSGMGNVNGEISKTKDLQIISKPAPRFTLLAKYYRVSGEVLLRVSFLPTGEIGNVSPVKGLPFGLTEMAVEAARKIEFEPAVKNGKPYSVSRALMYVFGN